MDIFNEPTMYNEKGNIMNTNGIEWFVNINNLHCNGIEKLPSPGFVVHLE